MLINENTIHLYLIDTIQNKVIKCLWQIINCVIYRISEVDMYFRHEK